MCVDHLHCWSPGRMAIWGGFPVQGWNPLCDADPPRGSTFFFWVGDGQTSCEWAPDTQGDHRWGFVAACAAIPCRLFRWMVSQLVLNSTLGILKLEKQLLSDFLPVCLSCGVVRVIDEYIYFGLYLYARSECGTPKLQELTVLHRAHRDGHGCVEFAMVTHAGLHQLACIVMYTFHPSATQAQAQHSLHIGSSFFRRSMAGQWFSDNAWLSNPKPTKGKVFFGALGSGKPTGQLQDPVMSLE